jgi:hypothetical protein
MATDISYSSWKAFTKKQKLEGELEDKELLRVLSKFDKTDESKPAPRLEALEDVIKEIPKQVTALVKLKKKLGDKPFGLVKDELYAILEEAEKLKKKTQAALDAENDKDDEEEEDEDSAANVLLQPKLLLKQLTMCKKDPERTMKFAYIDGKSKEQPPVLAMHPKLSAKKLFAKLQIATGVKTGAFGSAWVDGTSLMLQLDKPLSGLVKKVRGPVKACGFKIAKAVLWNADGTVFEQDDEAEETVGAQAAPGAGASGNTTETGPSAEQTEYRTRWAALEPRYLEALQNPQADTSKLRSVAGFTTGKAGEALYPAALKGLDSLEALVNATNPPGNGPAKKMPADAAKMAFATRLLKLRPLVDKAVADGHAQAGKLQAQMAAAMKKAQAGDSAGGTEELKTLETMLSEMSTAAAEAAAKAKRPEGTADPKLAFNARLSAMFPSIQKAMAGPPPNPDIKLKVSEFGALAKKGDFGDAHAVLDAIEAILVAAGPAPDAPGASATPATPAAAAAAAKPGRPPQPRVAFTLARLTWLQTRTLIKSELAALEAKVLEECKDETDIEVLKANSGVLYSLMDRLDDSLIGKLDEALIAQPGAERRARQAEALALVNGYLDFTKTDELYTDVRDSTFMKLTFPALLDERLNDMARQLGLAVDA